MAIFTAAAVATFLGIEAGFFATATAFVLNAAVVGLASIGVSYAAKAVAGHQNQPAAASDSFGVQGKLAGGGEVPRSFNVGYMVTAGSLVYANTHGGDTATPNAYITQVIALADLPSGPLYEMWVNGEKVTLSSPLVGGAQGPDAGYAVPEYIKPRGEGGSPVAHLYVKYYDGTQTAADPYLVGTVASDDRPYEGTRVGVGVAYVVVTALVNDTLWNGFPTFKFGASVRLYDPSKDDSVGGDGDQRYADPTTWGDDGDNYPAVQAYNVFRGFSYSGIWLYGLQNTSAARLPVANWITQIEKCRAVVDGADGPEPTYRSGLQINVNTQPVNTIQTLLTACQGKISGIGGFYKLRLGAPDSPTFSFTDDDIVSIEPQTFRPFFALADSVNGIQARYPDPAQGWEYDTAPAYYRADLEARDGNRRLMAQPSFDAVPHPGQAQRLQRSAIEEAQRARGHSLVLPPWYWTVEPGDVGSWTSPRNGYVDKLFRVDVAVDKLNLDMGLSLTEVDPADYDPAPFIPITTGSTVMVRPAPQGVVDWTIEPWTLPDSTGIGRRPALRFSWDDTLPGIVGIKYQVRLAEDESFVTTGNSPPEISGVGAIIVSQSLLPDEDYEGRIQYLPSSPRDMLWSDWRPVTTPDVTLGPGELDAGIRYNIMELQQQHQQQFDDLDAKFSDANIEIAAQSQAILKLLNQQDFDHRQEFIERTEATDGVASASIQVVRTVATNAVNSIAALSILVASSFAATNAAVASNATAISSANSAIASLSSSVTASFASTNANVAANTASITSNTTAIATNASAISSLSTSVSASIGSLTSSVSTNTTAIAGIGAQVTTNVNVNGYVVGTKLINGGAGLSAFIVQADKFQIQLPGFNGSAPVSIFTTGTVNGSASVGITGNVFLDGTLYGSAIRANTVSAAAMITGTITSASGAIGALSVKSLSIGDNAVTVPNIATLASNLLGTGSGNTVFSFNLSIDTTGLSGKDIYVEVICYCVTSFSAVNIAHAASVFINSSNVQGMSFTSGQWFTICGSLKITATGAVQTVPVAMTWNSPNTGTMIAGSNCFAIAAIR